MMTKELFPPIVNFKAFSPDLVASFRARRTQRVFSEPQTMSKKRTIKLPTIPGLNDENRALVAEALKRLKL